MEKSLIYSLLELAHSTSQNLGFAHRKDVHLSYGEETITETNLLELRRRHPSIISLRTFTKKKESLNGSDWEWHVIGRGRTLRMRVQAKRLQKNDKLKISHTVASTGKQQIDLLITDAKTYGLKPVYCFFTSEEQRSAWKKQSNLISGTFEEFEYGCLLACAHDVKHTMPTTLAAIEPHTVPWHFLVAKHRFFQRAFNWPPVDATIMHFIGNQLQIFAELKSEPVPITKYKFPTLSELNSAEKPRTTYEGVIEADAPDYELKMSEHAYEERGISKVIKFDVRDFESPDAATD